jgi:RNA polymerase sigma-70 factor (ECF subfamily)
MEQNGAATPRLVEHAFRHEYGRLVAQLSRTFGFHRTELIEDAVQSALMAALGTWARRGPPDRPAAWLCRVARNNVLDELRRADGRHESLGRIELSEVPGLTVDPCDGHSDQEIADDMLRMLFVCADEAIPVASQVVLALKVLCGFSTREIALRLFTSEENVQQRLGRGRARLRQLEPRLDPPLHALRDRLDAVHRILYLLFNEGYSSTVPDRLIRRELCDEAMRLGHVLAEHPICASAEGDALLALMYFHAARFDARLDGHGGLLLLEEQERSKWDRRLVQQGMAWLARSGRGDVFSRYHAEASVAFEHCRAPSYAETNWGEIVDQYATLERLAPSPLHALNRAIALAEWKGPAAGLSVLHALKPPAWLTGYYLWDAALGELERRAGHLDAARYHLQRAVDAAPHPAEKALLRRRLAACEPTDSSEGTA